jgi:hypothetical protein
MKLNRSLFFLAMLCPTSLFAIATLVATPQLAIAQDATEIPKWTDLSGSKTIQAKFIRLEGDSVVLEKSDGTEVTVPLNKLNLKSQAQAKRLANPQAFEKKASSSPEMKPKASATENSGSVSTAKSSSSDSSESTRTKLPAGISATETLKFIAEELKKDNYTVLMDTMSDEQIQVLKDIFATAATKLNKSSFDSIKSLFKRSGKVMSEKKEFIMNYPKLPPQVKPRLSAHYDTIVAILTDFVASPAASYKTWSDGDAVTLLPEVIRMVDVYGSKIAETEKTLDPNSQINMSNVLSIWGANVSKNDIVSGKVSIANEEGDKATLEFVGVNGEKQTSDLERVNGRWQAIENDVYRNNMAAAKQQLAQLEAVDASQISGQLTLGLAVVGGLIGQLERANSQEQFNQQMDQLLQSAGQMIPGAGGGPGLPPGLPPLNP